LRGRLFVHIPKNAGSSVKKAGVEAVRPLALRRDYFQELRRAMRREGLTHHAGHARWRDLHPDFQERECFAVVRNPYSRVVSRYTFLCKMLAERGEKTPSFREWMETRWQYKDKPFWWHRTTMNWYPQVDHITDEKGEIRCRIFRQENLGELEDCLGVKLERKNRSNPGTPWQEFYNEGLKKIVREWYKEDFEKLGYRS
jgi:hypothetical protein